DRARSIAPLVLNDHAIGQLENFNGIGIDIRSRYTFRIAVLIGIRVIRRGKRASAPDVLFRMRSGVCTSQCTAVRRFVEIESALPLGGECRPFLRSPARETAVAAIRAGSAAAVTIRISAPGSSKVMGLERKIGALFKRRVQAASSSASARRSSRSC